MPSIPAQGVARATICAIYSPADCSTMDLTSRSAPTHPVPVTAYRRLCAAVSAHCLKS